MTYFADKAPIKLAENRSALSTPVTSSVVARNRPLMTVDLRGAAYAASRISSTLKGSTKQFGWLQASATRNYSAPIGSEDPATIRIDSRRAQHLDVASRRRSPMRAMTSYKPTFEDLSPIGERLRRLCTHRDLPISDGREAAVDSQLRPIHEARIV